MARSNRAHAMLQAAADAAALAAGAEMGKSSGGNGDAMDQLAATVVEKYIAANNISAAVDSIESVTAFVDQDKGSLTVRIQGRMKTSLMRLAGIESMELDVSAEVAFGSKALEIVLVLDNTGSMDGQKINDLKVAAHGLVKTVFAQQSNYSDLKVGVVPYAEYVNIGTSLKNNGWMEKDMVPSNAVWRGCVGSRQSPSDEIVKKGGPHKYVAVGDVPCGAEVLPLVSNQTLVDAKIDEMSAKGNTYIPAGLLWGWNVLDSDDPIDGGMTESQMRKSGGQKAIVLMTDGENTISPTYPFHNGGDRAYSDALTAKLCANAKAENIQIYTVAFQVPSEAIKTLLKSCASEPSMAFDAGDAVALNSAFDAIGDRLANLYLSK